jgi:NTP pyrophosphatase (non-canonical NTP hydrolase)
MGRSIVSSQLDKLEYDGGTVMNVSITEYEDYLYDHYKSGGTDTSLFMKLVEEVGEVAEVLNKRDGRKASDREDLKSQLANELADVIHYAFAIASLNRINLNDVILEKDKKASIKYHHERNLEQFLSER